MKKEALNFARRFFRGLFCNFFTIPINAKLKTSEIKYTSIRYPTETEIVVETIVVEPNYVRLFRGAGKYRPKNPVFVAGGKIESSKKMSH